jgi:hypothetical protein
MAESYREGTRYQELGARMVETLFLPGVEVV